MAQDIDRYTIRQKAANVMQCRLPWSTALANAEDLDRAGLLANRNDMTVADIARLVDGATVSVDVSTGDHDVGARVFGTAYSAQREGDGTLTLLAEQGERNERDPLRELAEWLASLDGTTDARLPSAYLMTEIITRARKALGRTEEET